MRSIPSSSAVVDALRVMPADRAWTERRALQPRAQLLARVRGEFLEMPCLSLTVPQAMRLFDLREDICSRILTGLVAEGLLWKRDDHRYVPRHEGL